MSEANWKKEKAKLEKPGYTIVRQTNQSGKVGGILKEGQDGYASNWFEINKSDLGAAGGGGYDDTALWQETSDLQDQIDALDTAIQALPSTYATKKELTDAVADLQAQIDAIGGGSGGDPFDPSALEAQIAQLEKDVEALQTALATETQERKDADAALAADIATNTEAIATNTEAIENIKSTGYDDTQIRKDFAEADAAIQAEVDQNKEDIQANTDAIDALEPYDDSALAQAVSDNTEAISAIETEQEEQNTRLDGIDAGQEAQNKRLEALEKQGGTVSGGSPYTTQLFYVNPTDPGKCVIREYGEKQSILLWMEDEDGETFAPYPKKGDEFAFAVWENGLDEEPTIISGIIDDINEPPPSTLTEIDLILPDGVAPVSLPANLNVSVGVTFGEDDGADLAALQAQVDQNTADIQTNTEAIDDKVGIATGQDSLTMWRGTEAEYNLVAVKDDNTLYVITG